MRTGILSTTILLTLLMLLAGTSCQSREQRAISRLYDLEHRIDKHGKDYSFEDWIENYEDLYDIQNDMEYCYFTPNQQRQVENLENRIYRRIRREAVSAYEHGKASKLDFLDLYPSGYYYAFRFELQEEAVDSILNAILQRRFVADSIRQHLEDSLRENLILEW